MPLQIFNRVDSLLFHQTLIDNIEIQIIINEGLAFSTSF